jgi:hypothetical protein
VSAPATPTGTGGRIAAISPDRALAQRLAAALAASGAVDVHATLAARGDGAEDPALWVVDIGHAPGELPGELPGKLAERLSRLPGEAPVIAVLPRAEVAAFVESMRSSERVAGAVSADAFDPQRLAAVATRIVGDRVLGLDELMAHGTEIHTRVVADHADKTRCMAQLSARLDELGVARRHREPIEQCVDEMVMNALYDAPLDAQGRRLFAGVSVRDRIGLRSEHSAIVRYGHDGRRFAVSVRDAFGSLDRATVLAALHKCLHAERPVESRAGGAGLGLYLMLHASSAVQLCVVPGIATEVICLFELDAPRLALAELGFLVQSDVAGQRATGPSRRLRARRPARRIAGAGLALAAVLALALAVRGSGHRAATVELDSQPDGAAVEIDGKPSGTTPVTTTSLDPGSTVSIVFRRTGYRAATVRYRVPGPGGSDRQIQPLERDEALVRVRFVSQPSGAEVTRTGEPLANDRTYTPAELFVDAGQVQRFTLIMPGRVPLVLEPFTPARGAHDLEKGGALVAGATLRVEATLVGTLTVAEAPHCKDLALPAECTLAPGSYALELRTPDGARLTRSVTMTDSAHTERLELGVVAAGPGKVLLPGGSPRAVLEAGTHTITVGDPRGSHRTVVTVKPGVEVTAE